MQYDYEGFNRKMQVLQAQQDTIVQMEKYEKIEQKQIKKRKVLERMQTRRDRNRKDSSDIDSDSSEQSESSSEDHNEVQAAPILQKRPYNLKKKMDQTVY